MRWLYPEPEQYLTAFPDLLVAFGGRSFTDETVWRLGDFAAVGLWMRPGVEPDGEATIAHCEATVSPARLADLFALFEQMEDAHPTIPCGTCRGSARIPTGRARVWDPSSCERAWRSGIATICRLTWTRRTHGTCRSTSGTGSR